MLGTIWNTLLITPILNVMVWLYQISGNLGIAIILLTVIVRLISVPFSLPSMRTMKKQRILQPELDEIKKKFKHDKRKQAELQMELFKKHGVNPAAGCLPQIGMIVLLIALYNVINMFALKGDLITLNNSIYFDFLKFTSDAVLNTKFLYLNLIKPDPFYVLAILSGLLQLVVSKMMMPEVERGEKLAKETVDKTDDIAYNMQQQSLYMMPIMSVVIGLTLPSGVVLYIVTTTIFSIIQTYFVSGLGGLNSWIKKLKSAILRS